MDLSKLGFFDPPLKPYKALDTHGNEILIQPKNPENHESVFELQNNPMMFKNLHIVLESPDEELLGRTDECKENEEVVIYKKGNFYAEINHPSKNTFKDYSMTVVCRIDKKNKRGKTLTYYDDPPRGNL